MMNNLKTVTISELRQGADEILNSLKENEGYYLLSRSQARAVLLETSRYEELRQQIEDLLDAVELERARREKTISWKKYLQQRYAPRSQRKSSQGA